MDIHEINQAVKNIGERFTKVPNFIVARKDLSDGAFRTYVVIRSFKFNENEVFPGLERLSLMRGKTKRTISNHIRELQNKGLLKAERRGFAKTNTYSFIGEENFINEYLVGAKNFAPEENKSSSLSGKKFPPNNTKNNKTKINKREKSIKKGIELLRDTVHRLGIKK